MISNHTNRKTQQHRSSSISSTVCVNALTIGHNDTDSADAGKHENGNTYIFVYNKKIRRWKYVHYNDIHLYITRSTNSQPLSPYRLLLCQTWLLDNGESYELMRSCYTYQGAVKTVDQYDEALNKNDYSCGVNLFVVMCKSEIICSVRKLWLYENMLRIDYGFNSFRTIASHTLTRDSLMAEIKSLLSINVIYTVTHRSFDDDYDYDDDVANHTQTNV